MARKSCMAQAGYDFMARYAGVNAESTGPIAATIRHLARVRVRA